MIATISTKGQLTIPKAIRDHLSLHPGDKVMFFLEERGSVRFTPVTYPITSLKGMVPKPARTVTLEEMQTAIEQEGGTL